MKELLKKVRRLEIKTKRMVDSTFAGEYHSAFKGQGLEFDEVRPYQYGDDIRAIDWNVTAKTGEPYIKTFREEREQTMFVLFDVSGSEDFGGEGENKLMVGTEIAAILAFSAMRNNDKIGLATFTDRIERFYAPKKGRQHILAIIRGLLQQKMVGKKTDIGHAVEWVQRTVKRKAVFIIVSDFLDHNYERALKHLARRHEVILVRLFNPKEILDTGVGTIPVYDNESGRMIWLNVGDTGYRSVVADRFREIARQLERLGKRHQMDLISIDTSQDYIYELEKFFRKRNARKRKA
ncbi:MAG: DUF58 domain-containing protein [Bacteroidota bacterium]